MFNELGYGAGAGGGAFKQGGAAAQPARVPQRSNDDRFVAARDEAQVFVVGANASTLAIVNSLRPSGENDAIAATLIPLAWTPLGVVLGETRQEVAISLRDLFDWIDRTFPPGDEHTFIAPLHDLELLTRIAWDSAFPEPLTERSLLNDDDLPDEIVDAFARPPVALVQCATCRRLCVGDEFVWKEKQLCAWDYHAQVFGKRGPWQARAYEERHFETLPSCAYVAPPLLADLRVDVLLTIGALPEPVARTIVNAALEGAGTNAHMAVRTPIGVVVLREI